MKKNRYTNILIIFLVAMNLILVAVLLMGPPVPPHHPKQIARDLRRTLDLNEEQHERFLTLFQQHHQGMRELHQSLLQLRKKLPETLLMGAEESIAFRQKLNELDIRRNQMLFEHYAQLQQLFTEEQYRKFVRLHSQRPGPPMPN